MLKKFSLIILLFFLFFSFICLKEIFFTKNKLFFSKEIKIEKGKSLKEIAFLLEKEGAISRKEFFLIYVIFTGNLSNLKAGEYLIKPRETIKEVAEKIIKGETIKEKITILEGWNLRDIGYYLENKGLYQAEEFFEIAGFPGIDYRKAKDLPFPKDFSEEFEFLKNKPNYLSLEGFLFPDTYEIEKGERIENLIRKMLSNFDKKLDNDLKKEISRQGKNIFDIIRMASLLEKEVKTFEDKKLVAGILWKRLEKGIPLQVDATITYLTGKKTTKISLEDLSIDSPYNTYKYKGLPIGPICNPGLDSIIAAIYPEYSEYWYYLSAPDGKTIFSKSFEEHKKAKEKYLK